ncbi:MAG: GIY-YIG nuclease family protein [Geobacter sp.]|nr:GIY-YIG nuclease family protein [Geobacter sp.]
MSKCTPRQIISEVPDVQTVILPHNWFDHLNPNRSVFDSLYEWMLKEGGVSSYMEETLHNRTYVGEKLYNKLRTVEKKHLNKKFKIKDDELARAVSWSDINSGPITEIGGCKISGDVILVIPESSREALNEFALKIHRNERQAAIDKAKANAAGANFYQWPLSQIDRPDRVGDIARNAADDDEFPRKSNQYEEIKCYYGSYEAAIESLKEGWLEYLRQYPERLKPYAWCNECDKKITVEEALLAWSLDTGELFVLDADCLNKYKRFDNFESRPLSGIARIDLEQLIEKYDFCELDTERLEETLKIWGILPIASDNGYVYFIRSEKTHAIKIGYTAGKIEDRLSALQTAHPYKLEVLVTARGNRAYEKALHARFAKLRLEGEWFEPHPDLVAFISVLPNR